MSLEKFYRLTWYEWGLCVERITEMHQQRFDDRELIMEMFRTSIVRYYNWNRGNNPLMYPEEIWPLSYDKKRVTGDTEPPDEEKIRVIKEIAERITKRKNRG